MSDKKGPIKGAPEKIWLVIGDWSDIPDEAEFTDLNEVDWCDGPQFNADIGYVRADVVAALEAERDALLKGAARDVLAERLRQVSEEGWTPEHDDEHGDNQLADAAAWYAASPSVRCELEDKGLVFWPWAEQWWKPGDRRRELVKAGALILAEIDRIDRAAIAAKEPNRE